MLQPDRASSSCRCSSRITAIAACIMIITVVAVIYNNSSIIRRNLAHVPTFNNDTASVSSLARAQHDIVQLYASQTRHPSIFSLSLRASQLLNVLQHRSSDQTVSRRQPLTVDSAIMVNSRYTWSIASLATKRYRDSSGQSRRDR
jgi:hypothetical protein